MIKTPISMTTAGNENNSKPLVKNGVRFNTAIISPSETMTSLQIVCFFDYQKNRHYEGGTYAVNEHFGGEIDLLRRSGFFRGAVLETLLITPLLKQIPADRFLLLGLGDPEELNADRIELIGYTAVMEAIKLQVKDFCFAPSLKDAGVVLSSEKTGISEMLVKGMLRAITASAALLQNNLLKPMVLTDITLLAGQAQGAGAYKGLQRAFGVYEGN
ncbi:M17 family peptidase N-terminal domain-containing protein [Mucilaginibacter angelicae]|uniref:M17 family peptidase N-terminal domain-containing protein n=1 Tax=Mucilaginibacter angelicae TaxID=869718 RepID=A0ABV6L0C0_9SPHI